MGLFDFVTIRKSVDAIEEQLQKKQSNLAALRRQLVQVNSAPASKDDLKQLLSGWVASHAAKYRLSLRETLSKFMRNPRNVNPREFAAVMSVAGAAQPGSDAVRTQDVDQALCALFAPLINQALLDEIDGMDWPESAITSAQRAAASIRLTTQIENEEREIASIVSAAEAAGITWNRA